VRQVLCNEKYIGNNVYNRVSFKLKKRGVANPPAMWVRADQAFAPGRQAAVVLRGARHHPRAQPVLLRCGHAAAFAAAVRAARLTVGNHHR
jgi:hypothetical protein